MYLGGDHGKGSYLFLVIVLIRYNNKSDPYRLEIKISEINEDKDNIDYIEQLIKKISSELDQIKINKEGDCYMSSNDLHEVNFSKEHSTSGQCYWMKFYIICDIKGEFQLIRRSGFDSSYCLYCQYQPKQWKQSYKDSSAYIDSES